MNTIRIYETDSHARQLQARVLSCEESENGWLVELDRTIFYPTGGGQPCDTGTLGGADVTETFLRGETVLHRCTAALPAGADVTGEIDWARRLDLMQQHSGEHLVSGLIHARFGYENVGFHLGADLVTIDFNGEVDEQALQELERAANEAVWADFAPHIWYPEPDELARLSYRSKLELTEDVRIVEIGNIDCCACCAPHVAHTGEIGVIKIFTAERHRGGVRVTLLCGMDALDDYRRRQDSAAEISQLLSVPRGEIAPAVRRVLDELARLKERLAETSRELVTARAAAQSFTDGNICVFDSTLDDIALRELVNLLMEKCTGFAAAFSGSDEAGYKYIIGSRHIDLRKAARDINAAIGGRGGGRPEMIQGSASETKEIIQKFVENVHV